MKRFYFVFLLLFIMLTGWGCAQKPDSTPSVVPTTTSNQPAAPVTTTTTPPVTVATTTPDNAVSTTAWHRFSFSELGFSIQLPFEEGRITASLQEDTSKKMSWFKGYLKGKSASTVSPTALARALAAKGCVLENSTASILATTDGFAIAVFYTLLI